VAIVKEERIGGQRLILGDCIKVMPLLGKFDAVVTDPPYEAVMQNKWGALQRQVPSSHVRHESLGFGAIDHIRDQVAQLMCKICDGWLIAFCMAEGVRAWRDAIEAQGVKYKRAMVWVKPDAMPQFNGQGPSVGHEMMVSAWCGKGHSKWNGGGRAGTFICNKNTIGGADHPTQKPLPLISDLVGLFSNAGQTILDPFMGSGTTLVACQKLGRAGTGIELDPEYFDIACRRVDEAARQGDLFIAPATPAPKQEGFDL
jgi:site-specific DNA-methyltransferase (adenine-specific)